MLTQVIQDTINEQINHELASAYLYLSMAAYCDAAGLAGCAHWMRAQSREEVAHAMKFYDFVHDRGGRVAFQAIAQPSSDFASLLDMFQKVLAHEQKVTGLINRLYELALQEKDYPTQAFLQWFISEQVEEEKTATQIIDQLKLSGGQGTALLMLDGFLGKRA